jgi:hypothetical protein
VVSASHSYSASVVQANDGGTRVLIVQLYIFNTSTRLVPVPGLVLVLNMYEVNSVAGQMVLRAYR